MSATESVLITTAIDVFNNRYVVVVDIPGASFTEDMNEEVILVLEDVLVEITEVISPSTYIESKYPLEEKYIK